MAAIRELLSVWLLPRRVDVLLDPMELGKNSKPYSSAGGAFLCP
jgi:hypothetical protein